MNNHITLRLMVELPDELAAQCFENTLKERIATFGKIEHSETKRYWKIPHWFELNILLQPSTDSESAYQGILTSLGEGWEQDRVSAEWQWAIWNPGPGTSFFSAQVRWANVERFPETNCS
jgi:hypothetical protein